MASTSLPAFTITIRALRDADDGFLPRRLTELAEAFGCTPTDDEPIPLAVWWALPSTTASAIDRVGLLRCVEPSTGARPLICLFARACAERARGYADAAASSPRAEAAIPTTDAASYARDATDAAIHATYAIDTTEAATYAADAATYAAFAAFDCNDPDAAYDSERAAQRADLERLFLGVGADAEGVATGCPRRDPDHTARSPSVGLLGGPMRPDRVIWEITYADEDQVDPLLADGWEPFAVVQEARDYGHKVTVVWLRRQKTEVPCG